MRQFVEFVDRKQREAKKQLKLVDRVLRKGGFQVYSHLEEENPYIYVKNPSAKMTFGGLRVYEVGEMIAYRVQKEEKTEPYGKAYRLDVEDMFNDFMSENMSEEEAGKKVIASVTDELKKFFHKSGQAEDRLRDEEEEKPGLIVKTGGGELGGGSPGRP